MIMKKLLIIAIALTIAGAALAAHTAASAPIKLDTRRLTLDASGKIKLDTRTGLETVILVK